MDFLIFGTGAIGTYIGGSLALVGHRVVFLDHPEVVDQIRTRGMRLDLAGKKHTIQAPILAEDLATALSLGPYQAALFALKSYDTQQAALELKKYADKLPAVLCLSNGVDNEKILGLTIGAERVIPGIVTSAIGRSGVGDIILEKLRGVGVADGFNQSRSIVDAMNAAGLNAHLYQNPESMKWSKMLTNLAANATSAILDMKPDEILADRQLFVFEITALREALSVMRALNLRVIDLPDTPVRLFAMAIRYLPICFSRPILRKAIGKGRGEKMPSFHIDLHSHRGKSEVDYLNGAIVKYGILKEIPTPGNDFLNNTLIALTLGKLPLNVYSRNPQKFLQDFHRLSNPPKLTG